MDTHFYHNRPFSTHHNCSGDATRNRTGLTRMKISCTNRYTIAPYMFPSVISYVYLFYNLSTSKGTDVDNTLSCRLQASLWACLKHWVVSFPTLLVRDIGLEPIRFNPRDFKSLVSAYSTNPAYLIYITYYIICINIISTKLLYIIQCNFIKM